MKYRQITAAVLALVLIFLLIPTSYTFAATETAETAITVSALSREQTVTCGTTITFDIAFSEKGINSYQFHLNYDSTLLSFQDCTFKFTGGDAQVFYHQEDGSLCLNFARSTATAVAGTVASVTFKTRKPGTATLSPALLGEDCISFYGIDEHGAFKDIDFPMHSVAGTVEILPDYSVAPHYTATSVSGHHLVTTEVWLNNIDINVYGTQAELTYDPTKLQFVEAKLNTDVFGYGFAVCNEPGKVKFAACNSAQGPVTGSNLILSVTFKMIDDTRTTGDRYDLGFHFYVPQEPLFTYDEALNKINVTEIYVQNGTITVSKGNRYDLNEDEVTNINDVAHLLNYLASPVDHFFAPDISADLNDSGEINIEDVAVLLNVLAE